MQQNCLRYQSPCLAVPYFNTEIQSLHTHVWLSHSMNLNNLFTFVLGSLTKRLTLKFSQSLLRALGDVYIVHASVTEK